MKLKLTRNGKAPPSIRLHASVIGIKQFDTSLLCDVAVALASAGRAKMSVDLKSLDVAEALMTQGAPQAAHPGIHQKILEIQKVFKPLGFLNTNSGQWSDRVLLSSPGDKEAVEAVLNYGDDVILTTQPATLPRQILLPLDIEVVTPGELLLTASQQIPKTMKKTLQRHCLVTGMSVDLYKDALRKAGLNFLAALL